MTIPATVQGNLRTGELPDGEKFQVLNKTTDGSGAIHFLMVDELRPLAKRLGVSSVYELPGVRKFVYPNNGQRAHGIEYGVDLGYLIADIREREAAKHEAQGRTRPTAEMANPPAPRPWTEFNFPRAAPRGDVGLRQPPRSPRKRHRGR